MTTQCNESHPNSPNPDIFLCILAEGHDGKHHTYDAFGKYYTW